MNGKVGESQSDMIINSLISHLRRWLPGLGGEELLVQQRRGVGVEVALRDGGVSCSVNQPG
jgi:hypothetical protein